MNSGDSYEIILPPTAADLDRESLEGVIANDLVALTERLSRAGHDTGGGLLGGRFGYGAIFENQQFSMHSFCWCERDDCGWCDHSDEELSPRLPHFAIKGTPIEVRWYKWIGRSMQILPSDLKANQWRAAFADCMRSVADVRPAEPTAPQGEGRRPR